MNKSPNTPRVNKVPMGTNMGTPSILLIFILLCLVSFAALSIVSANSDYKLSKKVLLRSSSYYEACNKAEESLALLDETLQELYDSGISADEFYLTAGYDTSYLIPISDLHSLLVKVTIHYPTQEEPYFYTLDAFQVVITGELEYDESLSVIK